MFNFWLVQAKVRARRLARAPFSVRPFEGARADMWRDLGLAWTQREFCQSLALQRTTARFRGTFLGPVWIVMGFVVATLGLGLLWSQIVGRDFKLYFPYITLGFFFWNFFIGALTDGARALTENRSLALQTRTPMVMYPIISVLKQAVIAAHNLPYVLVVIVLFAPRPDWTILLVFLGLVLLVLTAVGSAITLSILCAYIPDLSELMGAGLRFLFFFTPILWMPFQRQYLEAFWMFNPFFHIINVVRAPILDLPFDYSFLIAGLMTAASWAAAAIAYYGGAGAVATRL